MLWMASPTTLSYTSHRECYLKRPQKAISALFSLSHGHFGAKTSRFLIQNSNFRQNWGITLLVNALHGFSNQFCPIHLIGKVTSEGLKKAILALFSLSQGHFGAKTSRFLIQNSNFRQNWGITLLVNALHGFSNQFCPIHLIGKVTSEGLKKAILALFSLSQGHFGAKTSRFLIQNSNFRQNWGITLLVNALHGFSNQFCPIHLIGKVTSEGLKKAILALFSLSQGHFGAKTSRFWIQNSNFRQNWDITVLANALDGFSDQFCPIHLIGNITSKGPKMPF